MSLTKTISGWGGYPKKESEVIVPKNITECKNNLIKPLIPRGMGRSYGDSANFNTVLQTNFLDKKGDKLSIVFSIDSILWFPSSIAMSMLSPLRMLFIKPMLSSNWLNS